MTALPKDFIAYCNEKFSDADELLSSLEGTSPTSIRINQQKLNDLNLERVPWSDTGYYLPERPTFTEDPLFHAGAYYVQEASSMLLTQVKQLVEPGKPLKILDLSAAPGGKSTLLLDLFPHSLLVANEIIPKRSKILAENITKWGSMNSIVTSASPEQIAKTNEKFDLILVDAPCSGEGMFRKDLNARKEWSLENINVCARRQEDIIAAIYDNLKEGGILTYSTCTFNTKENEKNVKLFTESYGFQARSINVPEGIVEVDQGYRMLPHRVKGEGFFISFLEKTSDAGRELKSIKPSKTIVRNKEIPEEIKQNFALSDLYLYDDVMHLFNHQYTSTLFNLQQKLRIVQFGHRIGKYLKKKFIPDPTLFTLSQAKHLFPHVELSHEDAIDFLKRGNVHLPSSLKDGWYYATFNNLPIGILKKIGNRSNNYFPKEWRIINPGIDARFTLINYK